MRLDIACEKPQKPF